MTATVAICTRNRAADLKRCLEHVSKLEYPSFETLVVDNASTDDTEDVARSFGARYVSAPVIGLSHARNEAARNARTDFIAYIDDDAIPDRNWLTALADEFQDPRVMAVAGHFQVFDDPHVPEALVRLLVDKSHPDWLAITAFGGIGPGCNMAFRRAAFTLWPGFDERLGRGAIIPEAEEHRAFVALTSLGYACVYTPRAVVYHGFSPTQDDNSEIYEASVAYLLMLMKELPEYRRDLLRHIVQSASHRDRPWRQHRQPGGEPSLPLATKLASALRGIRRFLKASRVPQRKSPLLPYVPTEQAPAK